ncbi:MAG: guanylate kinase [Candidatus Omnitrophica bacterium]|nr:guanylate kinase [Candidatus Omnitrophota bacterium]
MKKGKIIVISGPSGSGKTTLYKKLLDDKEIKKRIVKIVSFTTRPRREGERRGRDYVFASPKMFERKKKAGHFLETEKVFGHCYGTPKKKVQDVLDRGKNVLLCIDVKGARTIRDKFPKAVTIFVRTPSLKVLACRLKERGSEDKDVLRMRLKIARKELKEIKKYDHVIINSRLQTAYTRLNRVIKDEIAKEEGN